MSAKPPDLRPIDLAQEVGFVQIAIGPTVEHRLDTPREHLETEDHVGFVAEQRRDRMKLPEMVLRLVVRLAEQHDAAFGERYDRIVWLFAAARVNPCAHGHAASGLRCKWSRMVSLFRVLGRLRRLKKVVHKGGTQDPIRGFCNPYSIGFSAISGSLDESPSLSADDHC